MAAVGDTTASRPVWLTGPSMTEGCVADCCAEGVAAERLLVDYSALDTLSNFTTVLHLLKRHRFSRVVISTSTAHFPRAWAIACVVLPAHGMEAVREDDVEVAAGAEEPAESRLLLLRDRVRSWLYVSLGFDPTFPLLALVHPERVRQRDRRVRDFNFHGARCFD